MLSSTHLSRLVEGLGAYADISSVEEFSFEANPATFTAKKAELWRQLGITRISLGIQSWDASFLSMLGRTHTQAALDVIIEISNRDARHVPAPVFT